MVFSKTQCAQLVEAMLGPDVRVQLPSDGEEVEAQLSAAEVAKVFTDHVPGVSKLLFRQQPGQYVLKFVQVAYKDGWSAFRGTALQDHLKWLMRLIVHHGHEGKPGASQYLSEVAEAFMDCQAVQARVVERIGLQIRGVAADFKGLLTALVGEYKALALKMLAAERLAQGRARDDASPTHYENRLTADIGQLIGLNADEVRRAALDGHARARFASLGPGEALAAAARCRELFDVDALLRALVSELNSFSASSPPNSMPRLFLDWACEYMVEKHAVFDEGTCTHVDVDCTFAMAVLEVVFLGRPASVGDSTYRGGSVRDLFVLTRSQSTHGLTGNSTAKCALDEADGHSAVAIANSRSDRGTEDKIKLRSIIETISSGPVVGFLELFGNLLGMLWPGRRSKTASTSCDLYSLLV